MNAHKVIHIGFPKAENSSLIEESKNILDLARKEAEEILENAKSEAEDIYNQQKEKAYRDGLNEAAATIVHSVSKDLRFKNFLQYNLENIASSIFNSTLSFFRLSPPDYRALLTHAVEEIQQTLLHEEDQLYVRMNESCFNSLPDTFLENLPIPLTLVQDNSLPLHQFEISGSCGSVVCDLEIHKEVFLESLVNEILISETRKAADE